jgi:transposase
MPIAADPLPDDPVALKRMFLEASTALQSAAARIEKLEALIKQLQRHRFGRRSEQLDADQLQLGLEDAEQAVAAAQAAQEAAAPKAAPPRRPARNRGALPGHLPRYEVLIDVPSKDCACCGGALHLIGEDRSEMLDVVPAQLRVKVIRRPRYGCRACEEGVAQAPAPERPIDGGMATEAMVAHVMISKFADHLPLHRQAKMFARQGVDLDRSTLSAWIGRACWWLRPLHQLLVSTVMASPKVFADDTTLPVLDPGRGRTKTGRLWCYAVDDRSWQGPSPPAAAYVYSGDRKAERPAAHLANFRGVLQTDGYSGFKSLAAANSIKLAFCWAHARRYFYDVHASNGSPLAEEALRRIGELYAIEAELRGQTSEARRAGRQARSKPLAEALHAWLQEQLPRISGKSDLAKAMRYALRHWDGLAVFLGDGRVEIDDNVVERAIRPIALGRKNALFAGSDAGGEHWALAATLIESAKMNGVEPFAYLRDVLERIVSGGCKSNELAALLPWNWRAEQEATDAKLAA